MEAQTRFVVTAWRDPQDLLQLRQDLYSSEMGRRGRGVGKVCAWRVRKPEGLPLLLEATADLVDVGVQEEGKGLGRNAVRLLYASAVARFVTGLADTQIDLIRDRPSWFPPGKSLQLPLALLEVRHRIVHRHLPSLAELKRAAKKSLEWLWAWYWSQLDHAFSLSPPLVDDGEIESLESVKQRLQSLLKTYLKERKTAIKTRKTGLNAAENALSIYTLRFSGPHNAAPPPRIRDILLDLLVNNKMMLPTDKKLGTTMSGAFLIWTPFLLRFCSPPDPPSPTTPIIPLPTLLTHLLHTMNTPSPTPPHTPTPPDLDPVREALHDWILHLLSAPECAPLRAPSSEKKLLEHILVECFSAPSFWNLRLARSILRHADWRGKGIWSELLDAAEADASVGGNVDAAVEMDIEAAEETGRLQDAGYNVAGSDQSETQSERLSGPTKVLGLWNPTPIGWMPVGLEPDE
ncbi:hypothetical protein IAQ61_005679 [Plenodomus lingam]|uniref:uncharacterized protein n=1 Tax=Leptosphaeria maculans TaxID=5022 RepID=UPI00332A711E|nr:hypothetical protein IAQ61_005679 [Plenodomus lingam]